MTYHRPELAGHEHRRRRSTIAAATDAIPMSEAAAKPQRRGVEQRAADTLRAVAEHEAAHAIVAEHFGCTIRSIVIGSDGQGHTQFATLPDGLPLAVITAAGDLWQRAFGTVPYQDLACSDLARFEQARSLRHLGRANEQAQRILRSRTFSVRTLADRLVADYLSGETTRQQQPPPGRTAPPRRTASAEATAPGRATAPGTPRPRAAAPQTQPEPIPIRTRGCEMPAFRIR